jgi:hypothetical protein
MVIAVPQQLPIWHACQASNGVELVQGGYSTAICKRIIRDVVPPNNDG